MAGTNKGSIAAVGLVALAIAIAFALGSLGAHGEPNGAEADDVAQLRAELDALQRDRARLEEELDVLRAQREIPADPAARTEFAEPPPLGPSVRVGMGRPGRDWSAPELSPEHKQMLTRQRYGALFRELALSDQEIEALLRVLAAHEPPGGPGPRFAERRRRPETPEEHEQQRREQAETAKVLGPERAAEFERLRSSLPARNELSLARTLLERVGEPMTDEQSKTLLETLSARESQPAPSGEGLSMEQRSEQFQSWRRERSQQLRESAADVLTPRQLERLEESEALMEAMRPRAPRSGAAGSVAPATPPGR